MPTVSNRGTANTVFGTSHSVTIPATPSGDAIVIVVSVGGNTITAAPADSELGVQSTTVFGDNQYVYTVPNVNDGRTSFGFTTSGGVSAEVAWYQVSGLATSGIFDQSVRTTVGGGSTSVTTGSLTTPAASSMGLIALTLGSGSASAIAATDYTVQTVVSAFNYALDDNDLGAAGSKSATVTWTGGSNAAALFVTLNAPSGAGNIAWITA